MSLTKNKSNLKKKIPDITRTLEVVKMLIEKEVCDKNLQY